MASPLRKKLDFGLLYLLYGLARPLPLPWLRAFGRGLGSFVWRVIGFRRAVVLDNLRQAFAGRKNEAKIRILAREFYRNLGMTLMEFLAFPRFGKQDFLDLVELEGEENLREIAELGKGGILVTGHFGNWELFGARIAAADVPVDFVVKSQSNENVDRIQNRIRERAGVGIIRAGEQTRQLVRALRDRRLVAMVADQDAGRDGIFLDFLGRPASVFKGPAYFSWKMGIPLLPGFIFRRPDGRHTGRILSPIQPDPSWSEEEAVEHLSRAHVELLEAAILEAPELYFWTHRRWKTRPPAEES